MKKRILVTPGLSMPGVLIPIAMPPMADTPKIETAEGTIGDIKPPPDMAPGQFPGAEGFATD